MARARGSSAGLYNLAAACTNVRPRRVCRLAISEIAFGLPVSICSSALVLVVVLQLAAVRQLRTNARHVLVLLAFFGICKLRAIARRTALCKPTSWSSA
eukprot:6178041-Pleurochrysis_carterae.AAC.2